VSKAGTDQDPPRVVEARRVAGTHVADDFTYTVLLDVPKSAESRERRTSRRQRTRLRSGKIVDPTGRFVTECLVRDLSDSGGRLRLPAGVTLPAAIQIYDDQTGRLTPATVLWRRDLEVGIQFGLTSASNQHAKVAAAMRRRYYAVER
jgi:PilZ domain